MRETLMSKKEKTLLRWISVTVGELPIERNELRTAKKLEKRGYITLLYPAAILENAHARITKNGREFLWRQV